MRSTAPRVRFWLTVWPACLMVLSAMVPPLPAADETTAAPATGTSPGAEAAGNARPEAELPPADDSGPAGGPHRWSERLGLNPGGHLRLRERISWPADGSVLAFGDDSMLADGAAELRLKTTARISDHLSLDLHYELRLDQGDARGLRGRLERLLAPGTADALLGTTVDDRRRLLDLTSTIDDGSRHELVHRIDRLALHWRTSWGTVVAGRQALTWGNGLVFNPMDLFNPFAPTDVERDYKIGDDMLVGTTSLEDGSELQALVVPRRDPTSGDLAWNHSSVAVKMHRFVGSLELDLMAARHYADHVAGLGVAGYLGSAAWRSDLTWTFLDEHAELDGFLSAVLNVDYSWVWAGRNWYGFVELYVNGLGDDDPLEALRDPALAERLDRGELYTSGRRYLAATAQAELHPLLNVYVTAIHNLGDRSGLVQPRVSWDLVEDLQLVAGVDLPYGARGTELGGFELPGLGRSTEPARSVYCWLSWFF